MSSKIRSKLSAFRDSGEIIRGRDLTNSSVFRQKNELFPGEERIDETAYGKCYLRELSFPLEHSHGNSTLSGVLNCAETAIIIHPSGPSPQEFDPYKALFLDIETTGLSGGTGTWIFLIGLGWFVKNQFILRQYFLRRPMEEKAILSHFARTAADFQTFITFNGKMFDLPLIQSRQTLTGLPRLNPPVHLDLLQSARLFWKKRLQSRSLRSIEETILDLKRYDDIPGFEIPAVYFDYLRRGKTERLKKVFKHNVSDILSMVTLTERIALLSAGQGIKHPAEALMLGQFCLKNDRPEEGIHLLRSVASGKTDSLAEEAELALSFYYKRQGRWQEALEIWEKVIKRNPANPNAHVELAKYFEHRCGDYRTALSYTEEALRLSYPVRETYYSHSQLSIPALRHRKLRLQRRLSASNAPGFS